MKIIFFDLDNTLTNRSNTVNAYAIYFLDAFKTQLLDNIKHEYLADTFNQLDLGGYQTHDRRSEKITQLDIWKNKPTIKTLSENWQQWVPNNSQPMDGLYDCLDSLINSGFKLCLVSNGQSKNQRAKLKHLCIEEYFEHIIISQEVDIEKPDPRIFEIALNKMNCKACDAFFVGDHPVNDYLGSSQLGLTAIWLTGSHSWPSEFEKPLKIDKLCELLPLVEILICNLNAASHDLRF